jgi:hypothetical protein
MLVFSLLVYVNSQHGINCHVRALLLVSQVSAECLSVCGITEVTILYNSIKDDGKEEIEQTPEKQARLKAAEEV